MSKIFLVLASLLLASCMATEESPVIYFSNVSLAPVRDIECDWVGQKTLRLPELNPGDSRSQSFYIRGNSDFFGAIVMSWRNDRGEKITREFSFRENNLPSIHDKTTYNYVQFYLDQEELEIVSSDAPDLSGKTRKMERLLQKYRDLYAQGHRHSESALISIQSAPVKKDNSVPVWLNTSY